MHKVICGWRLRHLREHASLTQKEVAERTGWSQGRITNIESGKSGIPPHRLDVLLDLYGADEASRKQCHEQALLAEGRAPRDTLRTRFQGDMQLVIDMELSAQTRWEHASMIIPGLLQTEAYMFNLFRAYRPSLPQNKIEQDVADRLERQTVLDNADQRFWFVIDEAALQRMENTGGSRAVLREQIAYLANAVDRPNIEIQVVPFRHGYYLGQAANYVIFGYDTNPPVHLVYLESYDDRDTLHDAIKVGKYLTLWDHQKAAALGPEQTRSFLRGMARSS
ncbi:helix-turn-helix domain-containing protein [Actinophytocola sp. NPDC049390]|uniref:helix-turn-helix domain-containing protein n=1 Tax=Actinophytocola sp. NPDC049390 TaxID=3363894 RepID=UPI0037B01A3F